jgi:hypothetical protein
MQQYDDISTRFIEFDKWIKSQVDTKSDYLQNCFIPAWKSYNMKFVQLQKSGVVFTPDIYDFFVEDMFVNKFGRRKLVEIIPGIFLALGIIGTFVGIAAGVSGLDPTGDSTAMKAGIGVLLSGMKIKFLSSIIGISLSVIWQFIDKKVYYPTLTDSFVKIRQTLDETFPTQEESIVLYQMYKNQEKQMTDFQCFLSEVMIPNMVSGFTESINTTLTPHLEQTQSLMTEMVKNASTNQLEGMNTMVDHFVSSLSEITGEHMKGLGEALQTTIEWQKRVHSEMSDLVQSMQDSAKGQSQMVEKTTSLTEQIHGFTDKLTDYQSVFESTITQLNETTDKNSHLQISISDLLDKMTAERITFDKYFTEHLDTLKSNVELVVSQTEFQTNLHGKLELNLDKMTSLTETQQALSETLTKHAEVQQQSHQEIAATLSNQAELSQESNSTLSVLLDQIGKHGSMFGELQEELKRSLKTSIDERQYLDEMMNDLYSGLTDQLQKMDERTETLKQIWNSNKDAITSANKHLSQSMNQFTDDMHRGLEHTFNQFDEELSKSVQHLSKGVNAIQEGIVDLPDALGTLKHSVTELNKHAKNMVKVGE